jgi:F-type H+-transporting ATPase subunit b
MKNIFFALCGLLFLNTGYLYAAEAGMPQLNPEFWTAQIFWLVLVFLSLYLIIWKIFLPKITYSIETRKSKTINDLHEAQKLKEKAEQKLNDYNQLIENARIEAKKIFEDNQKKLENDILEKKSKFDKEINKELILVEKEIESLRKNSISSIGQIATDTSSEIIMQVMDAHVNISNVSAIVNEVIKKRMDKQL